MKNPFNEIKKLARRIGGNAGRIDDAFRRLDDLPNIVKRDVQHEMIDPLRRDVFGRLEGLPQVVEDTAERVAWNVVESLGSKALEQGAELAAKQLRATHKAMTRFEEKHPDMVDALNGVSVEVNLKAAVSLTLGFDGFYTRLDQVVGVLDGIAANGLEMRRGPILDSIAAMLPTTVAVGVEGEFSLGITIGAGVTVGVPAALGIELLDMALEEAGVPE